jgi:hypothetical protein
MEIFLYVVLTALLTGAGVWGYYDLKEKIDKKQDKTQDEAAAEKIAALRTELLQRQDGLKGYIIEIDRRTRQAPAQPLPTRRRPRSRTTTPRVSTSTPCPRWRQLRTARPQRATARTRSSPSR